VAGRLDRQALLERERRWARPVGIMALLGVALYFGSVMIEQTAGLLDRENDATRLESYDDNPTALLSTAVMFAIGVILLSAPLFHLFRAAEGRSERVRRGLVPFAFIGPVLLGAQGIVSWFAHRDVADQFVAQGGPGRGEDAPDFAENLIENSGTFDVAGNLLFPAILGLLIAMVYISLQAMRVGLLTRFWGSLGMALGVCLALVPPVALLGLLLWFVYVGLMIAGFLPGGRPPAWETGEAMPWPRPGERRDEREAAEASSVEASGREVSERPLPESTPGAAPPGGPGASGPSPTPGEPTEPPGQTGPETQSQPRRKRKRRG
jgi:hypothetical protein